MRFFDYLLIDDLQKYEGIVVYGAGWFAAKLFPILYQYKLLQKIISFAVSKADNNDKFEGYEIKEIDKIRCDKNKTVVLTAVSMLHQSSVILRAKDAGFKNILLGTDYIRSNENMLRIYQGMNYVQFIDCILKKHSCACPDEKTDNHNLRLRLLDNQKRQVYDDREIVWISGNFTPRSAKIINALRKRKYNVVIIIYGGRCKQIFLQEIQNGDISYIVCEDEEEMMFYALKHKPLVYFFEPVWGNCVWLRLIQQYKLYLRPIVLGLYDVLNDAYVVNNPILLESEKYALENADGIVWRWFSKEYLEERKGFLYKGKSVLFHDYCGGYIKKDSEIKKDKRNILKLCTVNGSFWDFSQEGDVPDGYEIYSSLKNISNVLGHQENCLLDIFIGKYDQKAFEESKEIEDKFQNIRFFWKVEHNELITRLQSYDYACEFYNIGCANPMDKIIRCGASTYYGSVFINGVSNRFYDYIDAGLPIVTSVSLKQINFLSKYGVIVKMSLQDFDMNYLMENEMELKIRAVKARQELDIDNHIDGLIHFFEEFKN